MESNAKPIEPCACFCKTSQMWHKYLELARRELTGGNWEKATSLYAMASNCAEKLLAYQQEHCVESYLRTNMEFLFAIRKSAYPISVDNFVAVVNAKIENFLAHHPSDRPLLSLTLPLKDIAYAPLVEVEHWMLVLAAMDESQGEVRH